MNEAQFKTLRELSEGGTVSQRDLSKKVGLSLGSVNYIMKELIKRGYVKAQRFKNSSNKNAYLYILTPAGIEEKAKITYYFLKRKIREYEELEEQIKLLEKETGDFKERTDTERSNS